MQKILLGDMQLDDGSSLGAPMQTRRAALMITCVPDCCPTQQLAAHLADDHWQFLRTPAAIVPPFGAGEPEVADAIDSAIRDSHVGSIVICAHSNCAMARQYLFADSGSAARTSDPWQQYAEAARQTVVANELPLRPAIERLVMAQAINLKTHPAAAGEIARGNLRIRTWLFDPARDEIFFPNAITGDFSRLAALTPDQNSGLRRGFVHRARLAPREPVFDLRRVELA